MTMLKIDLLSCQFVVVDDLSGFGVIEPADHVAELNECTTFDILPALKDGALRRTW